MENIEGVLLLPAALIGYLVGGWIADYFQISHVGGGIVGLVVLVVATGWGLLKLSEY